MISFRDLNALGLLAISAMLAFAFADQFLNNELPCPLCLLQRVGFVAVSVGLLFNVVIGPRPAHYGFAIVAAVAGAAFALRQVSLHVIPGTGSYGSPFLGYHFYTWAFILFSVMIVELAIISSLPQQYSETVRALPWKEQSRLSRFAVYVAVLLIALNVILTFAECGPGV